MQIVAFSLSRRVLRTRREARFCQQPATEAVIVIAILCARDAILLAGFCNQAANLACRFGERALVAVRLVARHLADQKFKIVVQTLLHQSHAKRRRNERSNWPRILIEGIWRSIAGRL